MSGRLAGKVAVVAGGATGIGAATAERLGAEGALVVVGDLNRPGADATATTIVERGGRALAVTFDIADERSVAAMCDAAVDAFGGVDLLFNVAADLSADCVGRDTDLLDIELDVWDRTMVVDLRGYVLTMRAAIPLMLDRGGGAIVNTSSDAAFGGLLQRPAYGAAKAAVTALTRHVASRWGPHGVRCNAIAPGLIETPTAAKLGRGLLDSVRDANPTRRLGVVDDVAGVVVFLMSDEAAYVTGQVCHVNGGQSMW